MKREGSGCEGQVCKAQRRISRLSEQRGLWL